MWRLIFKHLFKATVVVTTDYNGEMRWRFAFRDPRGGYRCKAIYRWIRLYEDGTCDLYVESWTMA